MPLNHYVTLGRSGMRVSPFCLGAMTFGQEWGIGAAKEDAFRVLDAYIERGGNFVDNANIYNKGQSEALLGDYCASAAGRRDRLVIATKFMGNMHPGDPNGGGAARKSILNACEHSLRRLRSDHIDLYWAHFWDRHTPMEELMRTLDLLVSQGKVRAIGLSDHPAWICAQGQMIAEMRGWCPLVAIQIEYSLLQRTVEADLLPMAREFGLAVTPWSPLRGGVLSGKYTRRGRPDPGTVRVASDSKHLNERTYALIDELERIALELRATVAQVALRWLQDRPGVTSTIIGARTVAQLEDNLGALALTLRPEDSARLDELTAPSLPFPHEFLEQVQTAIHNDTTINGVTCGPWHLSPAGDKDRW